MILSVVLVLSIRVLKYGVVTHAQYDNSCENREGFCATLQELGRRAPMERVPFHKLCQTKLTLPSPLLKAFTA